MSWWLALEMGLLATAVVAALAWALRIERRRVLRLRRALEAARAHPGGGRGDIAGFIAGELAEVAAHPESPPPGVLPDAQTSPLGRLLAIRRRWLELDRARAEGQWQDPGAYWQVCLQTMQPLLGLAEGGDSRQDALVDVLRQRLKAYEDRVRSLERFRDLFFDLKRRLGSTRELNERLQMELEAVIPEVDRSADLSALLVEARQEKAALERELNQLEAEFEAMFQSFSGIAGEDDGATDSTAIGRHLSGMAEGMGRVKTVISGQQARIEALNRLVDELTMELADARRLQDAIADLSAQTEEMQAVIEILEGENEFLQRQIQQLLSAPEETVAAGRIRELEDAVAERERRIAEWEQRYADMEQEYLSLYEEVHGTAGGGAAAG